MKTSLEYLLAIRKPYKRGVKSGGTFRAAQRYRYDNNDNLDAITDLVQSNQSISMTFDGLDRLSTAGGGWGSGSFGYDTVGNIRSKVLGSQNLSYHYQSTSNRLSTVTGGYSFSYDDRGNVINNGKRAFQFNRANQLVSSGTISYQYDGHGRRVKKTGSSSGYSVYDLSGTLLLTDGPNGQTRYIHLGKELIAKTGSAAALEDKPGYTGHVEDRDLSLTYMQQRYYDPVIGRFYSNDPVGFTASNPMMFNRYAYANNNPYKFVDPDGRNPALAIPPVRTLPGAAPLGVGRQPDLPVRPGLPPSAEGPARLPTLPKDTFTPVIVQIAKAIINSANSESSENNSSDSDESSSQVDTSKLKLLNEKDANKFAEKAGYKGAHEAKDGLGGSKVNIYKEKGSDNLYVWDGKKDSEPTKIN